MKVCSILKLRSCLSGPIGRLGKRNSKNDVVWAKDARDGGRSNTEFWWPSKVIKISDCSNFIEVHWFNRDHSGHQPIKIAANLIKPFMDMIQVGI